MEKAQLSFEGREFFVPAGYDSILKTLYQAYWKIPSEQERKCKEHALLVDLKQDYSHYKNYRDGMEFETVTRSIR